MRFLLSRCNYDQTVLPFCWTSDKEGTGTTSRIVSYARVCKRPCGPVNSIPGVASLTFQRSGFDSHWKQDYPKSKRDPGLGESCSLALMKVILTVCFLYLLTQTGDYTVVIVLNKTLEQTNFTLLHMYGSCLHLSTLSTYVEKNLIIYVLAYTSIVRIP